MLSLPRAAGHCLEPLGHLLEPLGGLRRAGLAALGRLLDRLGRLLRGLFGVLLSSELWQPAAAPTAIANVMSATRLHVDLPHD